LQADFRPPAGQGDLLRAALEYPPAIALIDGIFKDAPTVRHREILWALSAGIPVFGAASMGALRAAELHPFGMRGVGLIFRWYRRYALLPDDAVADLTQRDLHLSEFLALFDLGTTHASLPRNVLSPTNRLAALFHVFTVQPDGTIQGGFLSPRQGPCLTFAKGSQTNGPVR